jgi:predicted AAA+ superfamily ATPase
MKNIINRPIYIDKVLPHIGKDLIKAFIGQRRVGKSYLMMALEKLVKEKYQQEVNIIRIDKEQQDFAFIKTHEDLIDYLKEQKNNKQMNCLFIDEIQEISQFELALRGLNAQSNWDIYITGSNANILSRDLATLLAGRCIEIEVYPLTYIEFLSFHKLEDSDQSLLAYIKYGGLPYLRHLELDDEIIYDYLKNIYRTILYRDIVTRHQIRNTLFLEQLVAYLADSMGAIISAKKISDYLKSQQISTSPKATILYLHHLCEACFVNKTPRYDIQGKKIFEVNDKYYFTDLGLRNSITGYKPNDINKVLENIVYNQLRVNGFKVYVGKLNDREIDFIAEKHGNKEYYQVAYMLPDEKVINREFGNLNKIPDQYPKYVISMDPMAQGDINGIQHMHIRDFLIKHTIKL